MKSFIKRTLWFLWPSHQSFWLQILRSGFDSWCYQIFWEVVGLERGPLSLASTIEEIFERKSGGSSLENREYGCRDPSCWLWGTLYLKKLALTSPTSGGRLVGRVCSRTLAMEFSLVTFMKWHGWWPENMFTVYKATHLQVFTILSAQPLALFIVALGRSDTRQWWLTNFSRRGHPIARCMSVASVISTHSSRSIFSSKRQLCKWKSVTTKTVTPVSSYSNAKDLGYRNLVILILKIWF
jgi:hypothetical protein